MSAIRKKKKKNNSVTVTLSTNALCVSLEGLECTITAWVCFHIHEGVILGRTEASHGNDRNWKQTLCLSRLSCSLRGSRQWRGLLFVAAVRRHWLAHSVSLYTVPQLKLLLFVPQFPSGRKKIIIYCCWKIKTVFSRADARSVFFFFSRAEGNWKMVFICHIPHINAIFRQRQDRTTLFTTAEE